MIRSLKVPIWSQAFRQGGLDGPHVVLEHALGAPTADGFADRPAGESDRPERAWVAGTATTMPRPPVRHLNDQVGRRSAVPAAMQRSSGAQRL